MTKLDEAQSDRIDQWSDDNPFRPLEDEKCSQRPSEHWYTNTKMRYMYSDTEETLTDDSTEPKPRRRKIKKSSQVNSLE